MPRTARVRSGLKVERARSVPAGSLAWGVVVDGFEPDRYDLVGAAICLLGVAVIMFAPRASA